MTTSTCRFYITGGTLPRDAASYVVRPADTALLDGLRQGLFCYVLTSRQMGKSSLMVRTANRLRQEGVSCAVLDLTALGLHLTKERWYDGLLSIVARQFGLEDELEEFWITHERVDLMQRWMRAIREVVLEKIEGNVVLFIDEIDAVRSLPFSADEFFIGIRACYNRRAEDPAFYRLAFCLLGVASPSDLIRDTRTTPFNIGRRIELTDFTLQDALPLAKGLVGEKGRRGEGEKKLFSTEQALPLSASQDISGESGNSDYVAPSPLLPFSPSASHAGKALLNRVLYWTGGHPYLTQRLCRAIAEQTAQIENRKSKIENHEVDRLCTETFLSARAREQDDNLLFVRDRLLRSEVDLASLLDTYKRVITSKPVRNDEANPLVSVLRLAGIVRSDSELLKPRNRIYARVFDRAWVLANMPGAELRRQRAAYRKGLIRATSVGGSIVAVFILLALIAVNQTVLARHNLQIAGEQMRLADQRLSRIDVATGMNLLNQGDLLGALPPLTDALRLDQADPERVAMHRYRLANVLQRAPRLAQIWFTGGALKTAEFSPDGRRVLAAGTDSSVTIWDAQTGAPVGAPLRQQRRINDAKFSPDGAYVATTSDDGTACVWNAATGQPLTSPLPLPGRGTEVTWSRDSNRIVTTYLGGFFIWSRSGRVLLRQPYTTVPVVSTAFSPDGRNLAVGAVAQLALIFNAQTGALAQRLGNCFDGLHVEYSPDGRHVLLAGCFGGHLEEPGACILDAATGKRLTPMLGNSIANDAHFSPDGRHVVVAYNDQTARVWDAATGRPITPPLLHLAHVLTAVFSPDGKRVLTASADGTARIWDARTGASLEAPLRHAGQVTCAVFDPTGRRVLTACSDGAVRLWDLPQNDPATTLTNVPVTQARLLRENNRLIGFAPLATPTGSDPLILQMWDTTTGKRLLPPEGASDCSVWQRYELSRDGRRIALEGDGCLQIWDVDSAKPLSPVWKFIPFHDPCGHFGCSFCPEGNCYIALTAPSRWQMCDAINGKPLYSLSNELFLAFSPDGHYFTTRFRNHLRIYSTPTGQRSGPEIQGWGDTVEFMPDDRHLVSMCGSIDRISMWDQTTDRSIAQSEMQSLRDHKILVYSSDGHYGVSYGSSIESASIIPNMALEGETGDTLWDLKTGWPIASDLGVIPGYTLCVFSPDSRRIACVGADFCIRDAASGRRLILIQAPGLSVSQVDFSPDGKRVVGVVNHRYVQVWDAAGGEPLGLPYPQQGGVSFVQFTADGRHIVSAGSGGVRVWSAPCESRPLSELMALAVLLSGQSMTAQGDIVSATPQQLRAAWKAVARGSWSVTRDS